MRTPPPKKKSKKEDGDKALTGPRRFNGAIKDVAGVARLLGETEKTARAQTARGLLPHRRLGGRIVYIEADVMNFLSRLPGVSVEEALANVATRAGGETAQ